MVETSGVVGTEEGAIDTLLTITDRRGVKVPEIVSRNLRLVRDAWQRPDGEELVDVLTKNAVARQVSCGFFYRWKWIRGESVEVRSTWLEARKNWHKEVREKLHYATAHMDSPLLVTKAAIRWHDGYVYIDENGERVEVPPHSHRGPMPVWDAEHWLRWREVRNTAEPVTEAVWIDDFLVNDVLAWAKDNVGIIWYAHDCLGRRLAKLGGIPHYGGGEEASIQILQEKGDRSIVASIMAHGTGKNLQMFSNNLVVNPPSDGAAWDQMLGRTHRPGQKAEEVTAVVYRHTEEMRSALDTALKRARYVEDVTGGSQKLLYGTMRLATVDLEED